MTATAMVEKMTAPTDTQSKYCCRALARSRKPGVAEFFAVFRFVVYNEFS
jgi:hypothetical protein